MFNLSWSINEYNSPLDHKEEETCIGGKKSKYLKNLLIEVYLKQCNLNK